MKRFILLLIVSLLILSACAPTAKSFEGIYKDGGSVWQISAQAIPVTITSTTEPTETPTQTEIPPTFTAIPPTETTIPTNTPTATSTFTPTKTATPIPPTKTASPTVAAVPTNTPEQPSGNVLYVSLSGDNSDGKTSATAWNELDQVQWGDVDAGDTILIDAGEYRTTLRVRASGVEGNPIKIKGNGDVILMGTRYGIEIRPQSYLDISGISFYGFEKAVYISGAAGTIYTEAGASSHIIVENCYFDLAGRGVFIQTSDHITVRNNVMTTAKLVNTQTDGIYSQVSRFNTYEYNNIVISNEGGGHNDNIQLYKDTSITVRGNYLEQDNSKDGDAQGLYATTMYGTSKFYNNVINSGLAQSTAISFRRLDGTGTVEIVGNTIYGTISYHGIWVTETNDPYVVNNIVYILSGRALTIYGDNAYVSHNFITNPNFIDIANNNFYLRSNSLAIDVGLNLSNPYNTDKDGVSRPQGNGYDIGAYEQ